MQGNGGGCFGSGNHYGSPASAMQRLYKENMVVGGSFWSDGFVPLFPCDQETTTFLDGVLMDGDMESDLHNNNEAISKSGGNKRTKRGSRAALIKGQWTDEEDRKLRKLVKQYGIRKWAKIAENLVGRAGKQCRERWHNHLRPDIKKDRWSEEEERILVQVHEKVGNRWAEIAKVIPGRSENTIKNHWNATKRRQNSISKRKHKQQSSENHPHSSILQDYIRSKLNLSNNMNTNDQESVDHREDDPSSSLIRCAYDDELLFMQNLFANGNNVTPCVGQGEFGNYDEEVMNNNAQQFYSDHYLSYMLNETNATTSSSELPYSSSTVTDNIGSKEMDLMEMVSSSHYTLF